MTKTEAGEELPGKKGCGVKYNTDRLARGTYLRLIRDFRSVHGTAFWEEEEQAFLEGLGSFRDLSDPWYTSDSVPRFKARAQLHSYLKKYRFADDVHSDDELYDLTLKKFFSDQERISVQPRRYLATHAVLREARKIAKQILGEFPSEQVVTSAKFGKKSSIGCPLSLAHIDFKLSNVRAFTGSRATFKWFNSEVIQQDILFQNCLKRLPSNKKECDASNLNVESLTLKQVPKSWKTLRPITPLTLIGLYYSHGLGKLVTERLAHAGLNIKYLQGKHRKLVKKFSITRTHATADLSSASDSITSELLNSILPRPWFVALKKVMTHQLDYVNSQGQRQTAFTASVLPMGNGATFPVETLIFYSVIKAIGNLTNIDGIFSVYGDDLIYPSRLHKYVETLFPSLGFTLNRDKTFVTSNFRESCGADYFHGVDVRPYFFPGEYQKLSRSKYLVLLYKVYNGLCMRWDPLEIRSTLYFLLTEMALTGYRIMRVPPSYPATAGIHVSFPGELPLDCENLDYSPIFCNFKGSRWFKFSYMSERSKDRFVEFQEPFLWLALQQGNDHVDQAPNWVQVKPHFVQSLIEKTIKPKPLLRWRKVKRYRSWRKGKRTHSKRVTRLKAVVSEKLDTSAV